MTVKQSYPTDQFIRIYHYFEPHVSGLCTIDLFVQVSHLRKFFHSWLVLHLPCGNAHVNVDTPANNIDYLLCIFHFIKLGTITMSILIYFPRTKMFPIHGFFKVHLNMEHTASNSSDLTNQKTYFYVRIVTMINKLGNYPASALKGTPITYIQYHKILNVVVIFIM